MADFEDEASANLAPVNGMQDDASELQHPSLAADPSQFAKLGDSADPYNPTDPYAQHCDPFASQPSSTMAHQDFDSMGGYHGETEYPPANEAASGDFGQFQEDQHDDLPANFAREAARNQPFTEAEDQMGGHEEHPGMTPISGRDDEADEVAAQAANGSGSNPFAMDAVNQGMGDVNGGGSGFVDNNDRPIMGYNPFLNEENRGEAGEGDERDEGHFDNSQDTDFYKQQSFGGPADSFGEGQGQNPKVRVEDERDFGQPDYHRLEEDEEDDDADLQMEPVENIQQPPEEDMAPLEQGFVEKEEILEDRPVDGDIDDRLMPQQMEGNAESPVSFPNDEIHPDDTCGVQQPDESDSTVPAAGMGLDAHSAEPDFDQPGEAQDQTRDYQEDEYHQDKTQAPGIDFEKEGIYEDEQREEVREEDEENIPPQSKGPGEEDLGIVNQAFSDDVDMDGGKSIPEEEEFVQREVPAAEVAPGLSADNIEDRVEEEEKEEEEEMMEREQPIGREEEKDDIAAEEKQQEEERMEEQERPMEMNEEKLGGDFDEANQAEQDGIMKGDYSQEQLGSGEVTDDEVTQKYGGKDFGSRLPESDVFSSEHEDRSFVDNLSELASPDTVPQPLPSPPEPKDMSPFDPLAPTTNSVSPCHEAAAGTNLGQHGEFFEPGTVVADETNNTGDFLTAGEVEGETKFGVDGTAITQTATQNNAFLHSDDEEDEEEEEESQQLDQGGVGGTAATTETETSVEDRSGEFGGQGFETMENNDNALMSMSMEGSFYDDGGELIGGDDRREATPHENHSYQGGAITEENFIQQDDFEQKQQDSYLMNQAGFGQQIQNDFSENSYQPPSHGDAFGLHEDNLASTQDAFDPLSNATAPPASAMNGVSDEGGNMGGGLDSLLDAPVTEQGLQTPVTEKSETADSSVDNVGIDSLVHEFESSVDSQPPQQEQKSLEDALGKVEISEPAPDKPEEPSSSVDEPPTSATKVEEQNAAAPAAAAAPDAGVAAAAAAAAPGTTKSSTTTTTVKKSSSAKAGGKTATTTTTAKVTTKTTANNKAATTKKTETTTTTSKTTPRKPDSRPTSAATDKKAAAKGTPSPTKAAPSSAKPAGPLPSYAQPVTPRKPREAKVPTPDEKKKLSATPRLPSAGATRTPRPQSATTTTSASTTRSTTRTSTTTVSATSRTAQLARPKSSPTKLTNGTTSGPTDTKSTPKKYGIDARNEGYKPGGGNVKITHEKKEFKATSRIDAGSKGATPGAGAKPAAAKSSPRTPSAAKTGEAKSKIGSLDNATHSPGGGNVRIANKKTDYASVGSRIGSKDKVDHKPGGGNVKIENRKLKIEAKSKIGSLDNATHRPAGGDKKIESHKLDFKEKASPKIGSLDKQGSASEGGATEVPAANGATSDN